MRCPEGRLQGVECPEGVLQSIARRPTGPIGHTSLAYPPKITVFVPLPAKIAGRGNVSAIMTRHTAPNKITTRAPRPNSPARPHPQDQPGPTPPPAFVEPSHPGNSRPPTQTQGADEPCLPTTSPTTGSPAPQHGTSKHAIERQCHIAFPTPAPPGSARPALRAA